MAPLHASRQRALCRAGRRTHLSGKRLAVWITCCPQILTLMPFVEAGMSCASAPASGTAPTLAWSTIWHAMASRSSMDAASRAMSMTERFTASPQGRSSNLQHGRRAHRSRHPRGHVRRRSTRGDDDRIAPDQAAALNLPRVRLERHHAQGRDPQPLPRRRGTWPAFEGITGLSLFGRRILVVGFGPVGRGVAERARDLGAIVAVAERGPVRQLEALHFGCRVAPLSTALAEAEVIVAATGRDGAWVKRAEPVPRRRRVFNVGHSNREIDVDWLERHGRRTMKDHIDRYVISDRTLYLLNRGSLINIAFTGSFGSSDSFDPFPP